MAGLNLVPVMFTNLILKCIEKFIQGTVLSLSKIVSTACLANIVEHPADRSWAISDLRAYKSLQIRVRPSVYMSDVDVNKLLSSPRGSLLGNQPLRNDCNCVFRGHVFFKQRKKQTKIES